MGLQLCRARARVGPVPQGFGGEVRGLPWVKSIGTDWTLASATGDKNRNQHLQSTCKWETNLNPLFFLMYNIHNIKFYHFNHF